MFFDKVSLVTGGFDPIHSGYISYFKRAKDLSNYLIVGINTEEWLTRKKGQYFQSWKERAEIQLYKLVSLIPVTVTFWFRVTEHSASEVCTVAGFLSYKICKLAFRLNLPRWAKEILKVCERGVSGTRSRSSASTWTSSRPLQVQPSLVGSTRRGR